MPAVLAFAWLAVGVRAAVVSSVQTGTATMTAGAGSAETVNVTITSVDTSKSILFFNLRGDSNDPGDGQIRGQLSSSTNIQFYRANDSSLTDFTIEWYVVSFSCGVSVQRGTFTSVDTTGDVTITAVELSKSFVLISSSVASSDVDYSTDDYFRARLTSSTNLEIVHNTTDTKTADWQVVQYDGVSVQRGTGAMTGTSTSATPTISTIDTTKSLVLLSWKTSILGTGANFLRARITSATQVTIDRGGTTSATIDYAWEVLEFTDGTTVRSGDLAFTTSETSLTDTISPSVTVSKSVPLLSTAGGRWGGSHTFTSDDRIGPGMFTTTLTNTTTLTMARQLTGSVQARGSWFVIEFNDTATAVAFTDISSASGLNSNPLMSMTFADFNNDGYLDMAKGNSIDTDARTISINDKDDTFTTSTTALPASGYRGIGWGDYDNDGDTDLVGRDNGNTESPEVMRNDGAADGLSWTRVIPATSNNQEATMWADIDGDGDLDIWNMGDFHVYYQNDGSDTFTAQDNMPGLANDDRPNGEGCTAADFTGDGYTDFLWNDSGSGVNTSTQAWSNDGDFTYTNHENVNTDFGLPESVGDHENMEWAWGDYDTDGDLDVFISGPFSVGLYENNGSGTFTDVSYSKNVNVTATTNGADWGDYDNDGDLDLIVAKGGTSILYRNMGSSASYAFTDETDCSGIGSIGNVVGWIDIDNDGDLDIMDGEGGLWENGLNNSSYLRVIATGLGSTGSPKTPIGAQITVYTAGTSTIVGYQEVLAGYNNFQPPPIKHFGVTASSLYDVEVRFPTSQVRNKALNVQPNLETHTVGATTLTNTIEIVEAICTITDLGTLSTEPSFGQAVTDTDEIVGFDEATATSVNAAWIWDTGTLTSLGTLTGGSNSNARDVNASQQVVGWSDNTAGDRKAFSWTSAGGMVDLGTLTGRTDSAAFGINATGEIVGTVMNFGTPTDERLAFLYLPSPAYSLSAGMNSLGTLGGRESVARDINATGQTVGGAQNGSENMRPFLWLPSAAYSLSAGINDLGTLGGDSDSILSRAEAVNATGEVVGLSFTATSARHAFIWLPSAAHTLSSGMSDLGTLTGGDTSWAFDINDAGKVVGTSNSTSSVFHAFFWKDGVMTNLNAFLNVTDNWTLTRATGINTAGDVVGFGTNGSGNTRGFFLECSAGGALALAGPISRDPPDTNVSMGTDDPAVDEAQADPLDEEADSIVSELDDDDEEIASDDASRPTASPPMPPMCGLGVMLPLAAGVAAIAPPRRRASARSTIG